ncbi:hypothetical protein LTR66_004063 [Elasticomyces elasticus]|nr:hypothetical protein LTR66_004063 [Elasticomyces elasticus]KAK5007364.1 hypothetical protein LTR28_005381 [Elasticomyces elasticus]
MPNNRRSSSQSKSHTSIPPLAETTDSSTSASGAPKSPMWPLNWLGRWTSKRLPGETGPAVPSAVEVGRSHGRGAVDATDGSLSSASMDLESDRSTGEESLAGDMGVFVPEECNATAGPHHGVYVRDHPGPATPISYQQLRDWLCAQSAKRTQHASGAAGAGAAASPTQDPQEYPGYYQTPQSAAERSAGGVADEYEIVYPAEEDPLESLDCYHERLAGRNNIRTKKMVPEGLIERIVPPQPGYNAVIRSAPALPLAFDGPAGEIAMWMRRLKASHLAPKHAEEQLAGADAATDPALLYPYSPFIASPRSAERMRKAAVARMSKTANAKCDREGGTSEVRKKRKSQADPTFKPDSVDLVIEEGDVVTVANAKKRKGQVDPTFKTDSVALVIEEGDVVTVVNAKKRKRQADPTFKPHSVDLVPEDDGVVTVVIAKKGKTAAKAAKTSAVPTSPTSRTRSGRTYELRRSPRVRSEGSHLHL